MQLDGVTLFSDLLLFTVRHYLQLLDYWSTIFVIALGLSIFFEALCARVHEKNWNDMIEHA